MDTPNLRESAATLGLIHGSDPAFNAGFALVSDNAAEADRQEGPAPMWYGWGIRTAFWLGVLYARKEAEYRR